MHRRIIILTSVAAAAVVAAVSISQAASSRHPVHRHTGAVTAQKATARRFKTLKAPSTHRRADTASLLIHRFSVLRAARVASVTPLPAGQVQRLTEPGTEVAEYHLEPAQARFLDVDGTQAWVTPGQSGLCITILGAGGQTATSACGSAAQAASSGDVLVSREIPGTFTAYGLVPDGDTVTVDTADGVRDNVPVTDNFFKYEGGTSAQSLSINNANGTAVETESLVQ
jgi:hypothetical protein